MPRLTSNLVHGHEIDGCCQCNNIFQKFNYHRAKDSNFYNPDGTYKGHPAFHCDHNSACIVHGHKAGSSSALKSTAYQSI